MPDISMCGTNCPVSAKCERHPDSGTQPSDWQSWSMFAPTDQDGCPSFMQSSGRYAKETGHGG